MTALALQTGLGLGAQRRKKPGSGSRPFSPASIAGLSFWYDAAESQQVAPGEAVDSWRDLSGNQNHAGQANPAARPVLALDGSGRPTLRFDGVNDTLGVASPPGLSAGVTVFVVFRMRQRVDFAGILSAAGASGADHQQFFAFQNASATSQELQLFGRSLAADQLIVKGPDSGTPQYALFTIDAASATLRDITGARSDATTTGAFATPAALALGARLDNGAPFGFGSVDLYEVGLYPRPLDAAELDQLETYLKAKHGLLWSPRHLGTSLAWLHDVDESGFVTNAGAVERWDDLGPASRHFGQSGAACPTRPLDSSGRRVVRFDGIDDLMAMGGPLPALDPFTVAVVFTVRSRGDSVGIMSAAPASGPDVTDFWSLRLPLATGTDLQLAGQENENDPLDLRRPEPGAARIAIWTLATGSASLRDAAGEVSDSFDGGFGVPAEIVLGGRFDGAPFGHAAIDVFATAGFDRVLTADEQTKLIDWAHRRWGI